MIDDDAIEAEARSLVRQQMLNSGWYPKLEEEERLEQIEQEVERYWRLKITEARQRLLRQNVSMTDQRDSASG
jgi:hypothetical protein